MKIFLAVLFCSAAWCRGSDPGPALGHHIDRTYDDGYVLVDSTGNSFELTWNWGYLNASQYSAAADTYRFHVVQRTGDVATVLTDIYAAQGVFAPAPHAGSFSGPGPAIPDQPIGRSIQTFVVPVLMINRSGTNLILTSVGSTNVILEAAIDLASNGTATQWNALTNAPAVSSNQAVFTLPVDGIRRTFRTRLVLP
ncbi:MAG TPA: hypothetical protein VNT99_18275 [Methylomirabilota bacterium]|nr:hypothetical protein [Methylomirabilota bacterium]